MVEAWREGGRDEREGREVGRERGRDEREGREGGRDEREAKEYIEYMYN